MRLLYFLFLLGCFSQGSIAQTFNGAVYGSKGTIEGVVLKNLRTKRITTTNSEGQFIIEGKIGDSLSFQFFTYEDRWIVLDENDTSTFVVELIPKLNLLDEVFLESGQAFKEESFSEKFVSDIAIDRERYPEKYGYNNNPNGNINFVNIGKALWKLITKNKPPKVKPPPKIPITINQYISLFKEDQVINDTFLVKTLQIPLDKKPLFIDFCISQRLDTNFLEEKNKFLLIDELISIGKEFAQLQVGE